MLLVNVLFNAVAIVILAETYAEITTSYYGSSTTNSLTQNSEINSRERDPLHYHTFVALIDIVFTDDTKKTCTGTIIHDNVVITAAHCFIQEADLDIIPELTATFVVIGTKRMFDTGYEQYLPIERIITHPNFSGWTADLSLVYTFASMVSDKPGTIIPLAGEKTPTHVDTNVTLLSWGQIQLCHHRSGVDHKRTRTSTHHSQINRSSVDTHTEDSDPHFKSTMLELPKDNKLVDDIDIMSSFESESTEGKEEVTILSHRSKQNNLKKGEVKNPVQVQTPVKQEKEHKLSLVERVRSQNSKLISRYLMGGKREKTATDTNRKKHRKAFKIEEKTLSDRNAIRKNDLQIKSDASVQNIAYNFKNWRRNMGTQQNLLVVEQFGFVNFESCKLMVQKSMASRYNITEGNDVVCYANEYRYITDINSGAPAVRHGLLVAVTVGGTQYDGDYVAVGMKISCYCKWIADNLPEGESKLQCCNNCCDVKHKEEPNGTLNTRIGKKHRYLN